MMFYHTEDKVSNVWMYDYADFTYAQIGDNCVQNVRLSDSAIMDRAVWGRNKHTLLLQTLRQTSVFQDWFGGDKDWRKLGSFSLKHSHPLNQVTAVHVLLQEGAGALNFSMSMLHKSRENQLDTLENWCRNMQYIMESVPPLFDPESDKYVLPLFFWDSWQ